jgi:uncharacterized protein (DUF1697 family)
MTNSIYLALLRGINVGGNNLIKMTDLRACFESMGFSEVRTYIQSGNVVFTSPENDKKRLIAQIERVLSDRFNYTSRIVLVTILQLQKIVEEAPPGFGENAELYRYDVLFLKEPLDSIEAMKRISTHEGVDEAYTGKGVLYFSRLISRAAQSHLTKLIKQTIYQQMTIRNWNTTTRLLELMGK